MMASHQGVGTDEGLARASRHPQTTQSKKEVAEYVAELTEELSHLAKVSDLPVLAYLLDIAKLEARTQSSRSE